MKFVAANWKVYRYLNDTKLLQSLRDLKPRERFVFLIKSNEFSYAMNDEGDFEWHSARSLAGCFDTLFFPLDINTTGDLVDIFQFLWCAALKFP